MRISVAWCIGTALLTSSCAHIKLQDSVWYGDKGDLGAVKFHVLTTETGQVPKAEWDKERVGMACTVTDTFAQWKAAIETLCSWSHRCDYPPEGLRGISKVEWDSTKNALLDFLDRASNNGLISNQQGNP